MDLWNSAIFLEAQRHALPAKARHARLDRAAEYFRFSAGPTADFAGHRFDVLRLIAAVGSRAIPHNKIASTLDHSRRRKIRHFLPRLSADRCPHLRSRICAREKGGLDLACPCPSPAFLLPPVDVRRS